MVRLDRLAVAAALRETAALLAASGANAYKSRAYVRGARALDELEDRELARLAKEGHLTRIPGIGASLAKQIGELLDAGRSSYLESLRATVTPETLAKWYERAPETTLLARGMDLEPLLLGALRAAPGVTSVSTAGPLRRRVEVLPRLDLVAAADPPRAAVAALLGMPGAVATLEESDSAAAVRLVGGEVVALRAVPPRVFAAALVHETGSEAHLAQLAELARAAGVTTSGDGWKRAGRRLAAATEEELYAALGLPFVPPELREGDGELEAARRGRLPVLVTEDDVKGYVHCHTHHSDGVDTVLAMARAAERAGREYITITDHSPTAHYAGGLPLARLRVQWKEVEAARRKVKVAILKGTESDILADGSLDYPDSVLARLDVIVASLHTRNRQDREKMTRRFTRAMRHPFFKIWGHPLGRLLRRRPPADCDLDAVLDALSASHGAVEVNGDPHRLDAEPALIRRALKRGLKFVVSTDAHSTRDLGFLTYGVAIARRGWLTARDVLNTLDAESFAAAVRPRRAGARGKAA